MQLETMQYFDSTMQGAPKHTYEYIAHLKWALCDEKKVSYQRMEGQNIFFDVSHGMTELTIYTFEGSNGESVRSNIKEIDSRHVVVLKDISFLKGPINIKIEHKKFNYLNEGGMQIIIDNEQFGFKRDGDFYVLHEGVGETQVVVNLHTFSSELQEPFWCMFVANDGIVLLHENIIQNERYLQGMFFSKEASGRYMYGGVLRNPAAGNLPGISYLYIFDRHGTPNAWIDYKISILGGTFSDINVNNLTVESESEFLPVFSVDTGLMIARFLQSTSKVNSHKTLEILNFNGDKVIVVKASGGNFLIFNIGENNA